MGKHRNPVSYELVYTVQFNYNYPGIGKLIEHDQSTRGGRDPKELLCPYGWDISQLCDVMGHCWVLFKSTEPLDPELLEDVRNKIELLDTAAHVMIYG